MNQRRADPSTGSTRAVRSLVGLAAVVALALAGCSTSGSSDGSRRSDPAGSSASKPGPAEWACDTRSVFTPVGEAVDPEPAPDPEDAIFSESGHREVVAKSADRVTFRWTDDEGRVTRELQVERVDGNWTSGKDATCDGPYSN